MKNIKKTLLMLSLVIVMTAPAVLEINAYRYDSSLLDEPVVDSVVVAPLRHR